MQPTTAETFASAARLLLEGGVAVIPTDTVYGIAAACPPEWKIGTWVVLPDNQGAYICLDRGDQVKCAENGVCAVDILGPGGAAWDGKTMAVSLWVPLDPPREE